MHSQRSPFFSAPAVQQADMVLARDDRLLARRYAAELVDDELLRARPCLPSNDGSAPASP